MASDRPVALVTSTFRGPGLDRLRKVADVVLDPWIDHVPLRIWDGREAGGAGRRDVGATILIVESDFVMGDEIMDAGLIAIGSCRGDPNNVDVAAATARGIPVFNAPGRNADGVAEIAVALTFAATRWIIPADRDLRAGDGVPRRHHPLPAVPGVGAQGRDRRHRRARRGGTSSGVALRRDSAPRSSRTTRSTPTPPTSRSTSMLNVAEVVSMHAAVTPDTFGMMNADRFAAMRRGSVYVNSARAGLHDLDALTAALETGHLSAAALDHFDGEKLPAGHPLTRMDNVVLTPHIGGATHNTEFNHTAMVADDIIAFLAGEQPTHCVNPEVLS